MKVIILAAGMGTRLKELSKNTPKCLIKVNGKTILENQIELLNGEGVQDITVVIGNEGDCWTKENQDRIRSINKKVIINTKNKSTNNSYSLRLALEKSGKDDVLVIDGDLAFSKALIKKMVISDKSLILSKRINDKQDSSNRVSIEKDGKVTGISRKTDSDLIYGCMIRLSKDDLGIAKKLIVSERYLKLDTGFFLDELCGKIKLYNLTENEWVNINTAEELETAKKLFHRPFLAITFGYTAVGKSTVAKKIADIPNTQIFHSAIVRKELNLSPKTKKEADRLFDYRNNLRTEIDKKVYGKLTENAERGIKDGKNVVIDAGYFFSWQRQLIYNAMKHLSPEIFFIKVICEDEEVIKERLKEREKRFEDSPLNETPSWNTYVATKSVTEPLEKDLIPKETIVNVLEYDSLKNTLRFVSGEKGSENTREIMNAIIGKGMFIQDKKFNLIKDERSISRLNGKFVIALDFDGVITSPYKMKTKYLNELGYNLKEEDCGRQDCIGRLGIDEKDYDLASLRAYTESPEKLKLEKRFMENFKKIKSLKNVSIIILTSRYDSMMAHLRDYLEYHKIRVDGVINTRNESKADPLRETGARVFIEDNPFKLEQVLEKNRKSTEKCILVLYRNSQNKKYVNAHEEIIEAENWDELYLIIFREHENFVKSS